MARRKTRDSKVKVENVSRISGKVIIAGGDVSEGYTVEQVSLLLKEITTNYRRKPFDGRCPYKGLYVFEEEDADLFFGRERLVADLLSRVNDSRTVFITGPSGSGKSSLVLAGLIHALKHGAVKGSDRWLYETIKPGRAPIEELSLMFSRLKGPELTDYFLGHANETDVLNKCAESVLSGQKTQRFVLFVDQFEEVFTQINEEHERQAFIDMLTHAGTVENGRVIFLFAMRSDFVSNCATYPALNELLVEEFCQIGAMQPEELVSAIALPAIHVGLPIEDELIARIINDMKGEPGALPLMQFALKDLFDAQQAKDGVVALTLTDYLKHGGIQKSLERHADHALSKLSEAEQALTRSVFSSLIEVGRGTADTRRTALFDELIPANTKPEEVAAIVQKLADARLIITDEQAGRETVTLSHEKLIDAWSWLKKLVNANREAIALQNEIANDAREWVEHQRDTSYLYSGGRLGNIYERLKSNDLALSEIGFEYIRAGQVRRYRSRVALIFAISLLLIASIFASFVFHSQAQESRRLANIALSRQLAAQAQTISTTRNSKQEIALLLSILSVEMFPTRDAVHVLQTNTLAYPGITISLDKAVADIGFSPNGKYIVSGGYDNTIHVWDAITGKEIAHTKQGAYVMSVVFSLDSKYVVSDGCDEYLSANIFACTRGMVRVWDFTTNKVLRQMTYDPVVYSVALSPDGKLVVLVKGNSINVVDAVTGKEIAQVMQNDTVESISFSRDGKYIATTKSSTIRVWDLVSNTEVVHIIQESAMSSVAFSWDGKYIVAGSYDNTARVWELSTGKEVSRMTHNDNVTSVDFDPNSKYVVSGSRDNTARVWELSTGKEVSRMTHDGSVMESVFSPDGKYVVSRSMDQTARVWEVGTGREIVRTSSIFGYSLIGFSPDSKYFGSVGEDRLLHISKIENGKQQIRMNQDGFVSSVVFSPDSKYVLAGGCYERINAFSECMEGVIRIWDVMTKQEVAHMIQNGQVNSVVFSLDGKYLASAASDGTARVWEFMSGKEVARMTHNDSDVISIAFSPNADYVVSSSSDGTVRVWETVNGREKYRKILDEYDHADSVIFSPDGSYVAAAGHRGKVWDFATGKEVLNIEQAGGVRKIAFSPDSQYVASGSGRGPKSTLHVWHIKTGKEVAVMQHGAWINSLVFSPDGKYLLAGSGDETACIWDVKSSIKITCMNHDEIVTAAAFSGDGKYAVSASFDKTVRVWEVLTGQEVSRMVHEGHVYDVGFSPDGKYVISTSADRTVRLWLYLPDDLIADACSRVSRNLARAEWKQYVGDALPYQAICPNLSIEPETALTP